MLQYRTPKESSRPTVPWQPQAAEKPLEGAGGNKKLKPKSYEEIRELVRAEMRQATR